MTRERVLIVSAHPLFREGIVRLLGDRVEVIGAVATWEEAQALIDETSSLVIIVDHQDADLQEADLAPLLWRGTKNLRVIYVTLAGDEMTVHERRQVAGAGEVELLQALKGEPWTAEATAPPTADRGPQWREKRMDRRDNRKHLIIIALLVAITTAVVILLLENSSLMPTAASRQAQPVDWLFGWHLRVIGFLFSLIVVFVLYSVIVFRRRPGETGEGAYFHGNTRLEIIWTILPLITVLLFATLGARGLAQATAAEKDELVVEVTALQFDWWFTYPQYNVVNSQELVLPVNRPVYFKITSKDVIHSFWVPEFRIKQDAVPGLITDLHIRPLEVGEYKLRCSEVCGVLHYAMVADVRVVDQAAFDAWVAEQAAAGAEAVPAELSELARKGAELAASLGCTACHNVTGQEGGLGPTWKGLFGAIVELTDGTTTVADEAYLRRAILEPNAQVVAGYPSNVMPQTYKDQLTEEQLKALVAYIESLAQ